MTIDSSLLRRENESVLEYQIRLCESKEDFGLSWDDIAEQINFATGEHKNKDTYRKWYSSFKAGMEYMLEKSFTLSPTSISTEIDEIKKERMKLSDERRVRNNDLRNDARLDMLREDILYAVNVLAERKPLVWNRPNATFDQKNEAVSSWNDWHVGMKAENHWNVFNEDVLYSRVQKLIAETIEDGKRHNVGTLHVFINGDMVDGILHVTSRINSTMDVVKQTQVASELLSESVATLANVFDQIHLYFAKGNHERTHSSKSESIAKESFFDFIPWFMEERLKDFGNVVFHENKYDHEIINAKVCGLPIFAVHGHRDNIGNVVQNITLMTGVKPYAIYTAHIHKYNVTEVHGVYVLTSPSLSGVDTYAKESRLTGNAGQLMTVYNSDGAICTYNIRLDK